MNWLKYKNIYFGISLFMVFVSIFSLFKWGLKLGVDFTGGSIAEIQFEDQVSTEDITSKLNENQIDVQSIQKTSSGNYLIKMKSLNVEEKTVFNNVLSGFGNFTEVKYENVGPSIGNELVKKTLYAIAIASIGILSWVAFQFKDFKYGISAILAMLHDSFILVGSFSLLGHFFGAEADFLFVTALLTTLSFSVHDTIVVFDRIRETERTQSGTLFDLANKALSETMVRSLNNSFTIMFMLLALILLGGSTVKWFATALLIGTVLGTYSSPFVATPLLIVLDKFKKENK